MTETFSEEAAVEEELLLVTVVMVMLDCCSKDECFKCLAICASADSEKRMVLPPFSTATLTTLTEGSGLLAALLLRQGAALLEDSSVAT